MRPVRAIALVASLFLAACQLTLPGGGGQGAAATSPISGGAITTTSLAPASVEAGAAGQAGTPAGADTGASVPPQTTPAPAASGETGAATSPETAVAAPAAPVVAKTPAQMACEKSGGRWNRVGGGNACVRPMRDSGKSCRRKADCQGQCLARSGTCAPFEPLFGCNEIIDSSGARMTLCID